MAIVFSDEIEAILQAGPPRIDWEAISAELKAEFLAGPSVASAMQFDGDGTEGSLADTRSARLFAPTVELRGAEPGSGVDRCAVWACLHAREVTADLRVDRPVVVASSGSVAELKGLGAPWVTFSVASVGELNAMGIDCAQTTRRARYRRIEGAVVYRGKEDTELAVRTGVMELLSVLTGDVTYVTAHPEDSSALAEGFMHMFSNGGRVCGYASRAATCGLCNDTGLVVGDLYGAPPDVEGSLPYCVCGAGSRREVKDEEDAEYDAGAFIMGRYDGDPSDDFSASRWGVDEMAYTRGDCFEPPGLPECAADTVAVSSAGLGFSLNSAVGGLPGDGPQRDDGESPGHMVGWCYLEMVKEEYHEEANQHLEGEWPVVERLLRAPAVYFDLVAMGRLGFEVWDNSVGLFPGFPRGRLLHVKPLGATGGRRVFLSEALRWVCKDSGMDYADGTLARALSADQDCYRVEPGVSLHERVGGGEPAQAGPGRDRSRLASPRDCLVPTVVYKQGVGASGEVTAVGTTRLVSAVALDAVGPKVMCDTCGYEVNPFGHELRCVPGGHADSGYSGFVAPAWLGDAAHALDVRAVLLSMDLEPMVRHLEHNRLTSAADQAKYYRSLAHPPVSPVPEPGSEYTDHTVASMFEAHYRDGFRHTYLMAKFSVTSGEVDKLIGAILLRSKGYADPAVCPGSPGRSPATVWAVVMPPGHGKSYRHGSGRLVEADALCAPKEDEVLVSLKEAARAGSGPWESYVTEWASRLRARAVPGSVVMVPDVDVAAAAGFRVVGAFLLDEQAWAVNLHGRTETEVLRARECYDSVSRSGVVRYRCATNEELTGVLDACCRALF